ncbi:uncharacterized protein IAS62_005835 [Cryptococcus decagattii]|uniref:Uncharacterized protein n=1 Tax=Cryptococcus decagattii TaxID=1859122 RepID=A0ABZ2B4D0_9TREE
MFPSCSPQLPSERRWDRYYTFLASRITCQVGKACVSGGNLYCASQGLHGLKVLRTSTTITPRFSTSTSNP